MIKHKILRDNYYNIIESQELSNNEIINITKYDNQGNIIYKKNSKQEHYFENNKLHGIAKYFYNNGNVHKVSNFKYGKLNGITKIYHNNNQLLTQINFACETIFGIVNVYNSKGILIAKGKYDKKGIIIYAKFYNKQKINDPKNYFKQAINSLVYLGVNLFDD